MPLFYWVYLPCKTFTDSAPSHTRRVRMHPHKTSSETAYTLRIKSVEDPTLENNGRRALNEFNLSPSKTES
jgi:hypothetical protein